MTDGSRSSRAVVITVCVAAALTVAALAGAILLRPHPTGTASAPTVPTSAADARLSCDTGPCQSLATVTVGTSTVELLANAAATSGRVRISAGQGLDSVFETTIGKLGAILTKQSLTCQSGQSPVCMVSGSAPDGSAAEIFVDTDGDWARADEPYFASGGYLALTDTSSGQPEIVTVQTTCDTDTSTQCPQSPVYVQVFTVDGDSVGCTKPVTRADRLPGWPTVRVSDSELHSC